MQDENFCRCLSYTTQLIDLCFGSYEYPHPVDLFRIFDEKKCFEKQMCVSLLLLTVCLFYDSEINLHITEMVSGAPPPQTHQNI